MFHFSLPRELEHTLRTAMFLQVSFHSISIHAVLFMFLSFYVLPSYQISFNFTNFTDKTRISDCSGVENYVCLQGVASIGGDGGINLTTNRQYAVGRAVYSKPVRISNNSTRSKANFTTEFSFLITRSPDESMKDFFGDGLAFYLSPYPFSFPVDPSGESLGLLERDTTEGRNFVAVEFDTYNNTWDPPSAHVGIDVNSIISNSTIVTNFSETVAKAKVEYNADTLNLSVSIFSQGHPLLNGSIILSHHVNISDVLPENVVVGFTAATGLWVGLHRILSWTFTSSPVDDIEVPNNNKTLEVPTANNTIIDNNNNTKRRLVLVGTTFGVGVLVTSICVVLACLFFRKKSKDIREGEGNDDDDEMRCIDEELEDGRGPNPRRFPYQALVNATENFKSEAKIGEGGFGPVYRGFLSDLNLEVAIKRVSSHSKQGKKEYISEIKIISRLRHKNLVQLVGWSHQRSDLLLVYELMPNASLDFHLFNKRSFLPWTSRYKIAMDLASALLYLHEEWEQCVVHRDVKSSNVMLDSSFNAKLGDFGLARLSEHGAGIQTTFLAGTMGYMAPECVITGKASKESDVYSFGVVALEIACGRRSIECTMAEPEKVRLLEWAWGMYGEGMLLEAIDRRFEEEEDVVNEEQARRLMVVGLWCAHPDLNHRPSIRQAISVLNFERSTPSLPPNMPLPTYNSLTSCDDKISYGTTSSMSVSSTSNATNNSSSLPLLSITSTIKSLR